MTRKTMIAGVVALSAVLVGSVAVLQRGRAGKSPSASRSSAAAPSFRQRGPIVPAEVALDGRLGKGWEDWGWGQHELPDAGVLRVDLGAYGGVILHHDELSA